jgi:hypothetical protein
MPTARLPAVRPMPFAGRGDLVRRLQLVGAGQGTWVACTARSSDHRWSEASERRSQSCQPAEGTPGETSIGLVGPIHVPHGPMGR